jgi:hypothetical protein
MIPIIITKIDRICLSAPIKPLVRLSGSLASLKLVKVPAANAHVALVLVHAVAEVADINLTGGVLVRGLGGVALVETVVHGLGLNRSLLGLSGSAGATAEEATDSVANGGTDSNTTI